MARASRLGVVVLAATLAGGGCGSGPETAAAPSKRPVAQAELAEIKQAVARVRTLPTGRYVAVQYVQTTADSDADVVMKRRGQYDEASSLHQVEVSVPPRPGESAMELTFLNADGDFLMRNPSFTARHGRAWTRLSGDAVQAALPGADIEALQEPPGLDVLTTASAPGEVISSQNGVAEYKVAVDMYESIALLSNAAGYMKLAQLSGIAVDELATEFSGTLDATVVLADPGLRSLEVDLMPIFARASELSGKPVDNGGALRVLVTYEPGASVELEVPAEADIGPAE